MIQHISSAISGWLEREKTIPKENRNLFTFAVYSFLFGTTPVILVTVLGFAQKMVREGLFLILPFMLIRKFSGGFHLQSSRCCVVFSSVIIASALGIVKILILSAQTTILTILVILSTVIISHFSPIDNESRKLTRQEQCFFKKIAQFLAITALAVYLIALKMAQITFAIPFGCGVILAALLQMPCILLNWINATKANCKT